MRDTVNRKRQKRQEKGGFFHMPWPSPEKGGFSEHCTVSSFYCSMLNETQYVQNYLNRSIIILIIFRLVSILGESYLLGPETPHFSFAL